MPDSQTPEHGPIDTERALLATYGSPLVPVEDVCETYFGIGAQEARRRAALNLLPVPAFRMTESRKAPLFVRIADLAALIDRRSAKAGEVWTQHERRARPRAAKPD
jgi:hypothetical protein